MGYDEIRVYGLVQGLTQGANGPDPCVLADEFEFSRFDCAGGEIDFEYEGNCFFLDDFLERLEGFLAPTSTGRVDYIDHHAWALTRCTVALGAISVKTVSLNDVLDRYNHP
ncbi:MAG: hypothetical protein H0S85_16325 [Desulfovibrionaceae bacterium]|nr:hypothetical protein [Desulfovibrionaceae bacterium]